MKIEDLLKYDDDCIAEYHIIDTYYTNHAIISKGSTDISAALEDTLHRILEVGGTEEDVYEIMGAGIPSETDLEQMENSDGYISIDLGYVMLPIDSWKEV